ncbi:hypothetical protein ABIE16_005487, partial [Pseudomonas sp. 2725]
PQLQQLSVANSHGAKSGINTVTGVRDYLTSSSPLPQGFVFAA